MVQTTGTRSNLCPGQGRGWQSPHDATLNSCQGGNDTPHYPAFVQGRDQNAPEKKKKPKTKRDYSGLRRSLLPPPPPCRLWATASTSSLLQTTGHRGLSRIWFGLAPGLYFYAPQVSPCLSLYNEESLATKPPGAGFCWLAKPGHGNAPLCCSSQQAASKTLQAGRSRQHPPALPALPLREVPPSTPAVVPTLVALPKPHLLKGCSYSRVPAALIQKIKS